MPVKTITIDMDAYNRLKACQREGESFTQTIKRAVPPPFDEAAFRKAVKQFTLGDDVAEAIEEHLRARHVPSKRAR